MKKLCTICKKEIIKIPKISKKQWENKKYCSNKCRVKGVSASLKGKYNPLYEGRIPWNKGKFWSEEAKKKMSLVHMGMESPLKGRKRLDTPWNKGKYELHRCKGCEEMLRKWETYCSYECYSKYPKSEETRKKLSLSLKGKQLGEKSSNWKGGITSQDKLQRIKFMQEVRLLVFERDDYTCQICGERGGKMHVDHIQSWSEYIELRFNIDNCRTLCIDCHYQITFGKPRPINSKWGENSIYIGYKKGEN